MSAPICNYPEVGRHFTLTVNIFLNRAGVLLQPLRHLDHWDFHRPVLKSFNLNHFRRVKVWPGRVTSLKEKLQPEFSCHKNMKLPWACKQWYCEEWQTSRVTTRKPCYQLTLVKTSDRPALIVTNRRSVQSNSKINSLSALPFPNVIYRFFPKWTCGIHPLDIWNISPGVSGY